MRLVKLAMVVAVAGVLAGAAAAQPPGGGLGGMLGGMMRGGGGGMLLRVKKIQDELKIDEDQLAKLQEAQQKVREDMRDDMAKLRDRDLPMEERQAVMKKLGDAQTKVMKDVLKPEQHKRLQQIQRQLLGVGMFNDEEVEKAVKLNDDQKEKIKDIQEQLGKDVREMFQAGGGFNPEAMRENSKKVQGLQKEAKTSAMKVLTADQKKAVEQLTGAPFDLTMEDIMGGFGPRGGPGKPGEGNPGDKPRRPRGGNRPGEGEKKKDI